MLVRFENPRDFCLCIWHLTQTIWHFLTEGVGIDGDNPDHIKWLYDKSVERANSYGITGVSVRLTQGNVQTFSPNAKGNTPSDLVMCVPFCTDVAFSCIEIAGVIKRIIPAVASTNAVIAAACATEVFKIAT